MNLMVTADKNWASGNRGQSQVSIPEEQTCFSICCSFRMYRRIAARLS